MSKLLTSRDAKYKVLDILKELLKELSFSAMAQSDIDLIALALYRLRQNGSAMNAQMQFHTGPDDRIRVVIDLTNDHTRTTIQ